MAYSPLLQPTPVSLLCVVRCHRGSYFKMLYLLIPNNMLLPAGMLPATIPICPRCTMHQPHLLNCLQFFCVLRMFLYCSYCDTLCAVMPNTAKLVLFGSYVSLRILRVCFVVPMCCSPCFGSLRALLL